MKFFEVLMTSSTEMVVVLVVLLILAIATAALPIGMAIKSRKNK